MTEKITRRGVFTPDSYEPDVLGKLTVAQVINKDGIVLSPKNTIREIRDWLNLNTHHDSYFIMADEQGDYRGTVNLTDIYMHDLNPESYLKTIVHHSHVFIKSNDNLRKAVETMSDGNTEAIPVLAENKVIGVLSYKDIINTYKSHRDENEEFNIHISLKRQRLKVLIRGRELFKPGQKLK
jgi:Mg/Co/Ni transporter MgtE